MGVGYIPSTNSSTTPPHPKYQNNNKDNNQMKMSKFDLTEYKQINKLGRKS